MDIRITDANGMEIPCLGFVKVDVEVDGRVVKNCGLFVKCSVGKNGVVQGTQLPVLLGMNVLAEVVTGPQNMGERPIPLGLDEKWRKCVQTVEAQLRVWHQPLGWAVVQQHQDLVVPAGTRRVLKVFVGS